MNTSQLEGIDTVTLSAGSLQAEFAPALGMTGVSLRHEGDELLDRQAGVLAYTRTGAVMGVPLLYPWANRLAGHDYMLDGHDVRLPSGPPLGHGVREARSVPFASLGPDEPAVDPDRFRGPDDRYPGGWKVFPAHWQQLPDETLHRREALDVIVSTIASLPPAQRAVIRMRDVEGCSAEEVCAALDLSQGNQRVLLHRARSRVRSALEQHLP
jgi:RNA polymerase sigma factor (sigma-70 family)